MREGLRIQLTTTRSQSWLGHNVLQSRIMVFWTILTPNATNEGIWYGYFFTQKESTCSWSRQLSQVLLKVTILDNLFSPRKSIFQKSKTWGMIPLCLHEKLWDFPHFKPIFITECSRFNNVSHIVLKTCYWIIKSLFETPSASWMLGLKFGSCNNVEENVSWIPKSACDIYVIVSVESEKEKPIQKPEKHHMIFSSRLSVLNSKPRERLLAWSSLTFVEIPSWCDRGGTTRLPPSRGTLT